MKVTIEIEIVGATEQALEVFIEKNYGHPNWLNDGMPSKESEIAAAVRSDLQAFFEGLMVIGPHQFDKDCAVTILP